MTTLRQRLALRYGAVVAICLLLLAGLTYHEFVQEPHMFRQLGIQEPAGGEFAEFTEIVLYGAVPLIFALGWRFVRRSLKPIDDLARGVEQFHALNLQERLPRTLNGDEVDRLAAAFNTMAARLEQSFQQVHEFTLHVSHELKTPLTVMRAELETRLRDANALPPAQRDWAQSLLDEMQRLARIVDSLTLLTKADAGLVTLERKPVALEALVRECFEDAQILAEASEVTVTLAACEKVEVSGDRHRLRQLLLNLTDNAVKYNHPGGSVTLDLRHAGEFAEITVANTGPGIPPELQARVFERFVRGTEARSRVADGCGLGLTICQWIVRAHAGTIEVQSEPGQTTTFTVRLPRASAAGGHSA
jgi:signal transduction histidine kinase